MQERVEAIDDLTISWHVGVIDRDGPWGPPSEYGWNGIDKQIIFDVIIPKMKSFETMRWGDVIGMGPRKPFHSTPTAGLCPRAQKRLRKINMDDTDSLFSVKFGSRERMWGIKTGNTLKILWWDPEHEVYPTPQQLHPPN